LFTATSTISCAKLSHQFHFKMKTEVEKRPYLLRVVGGEENRGGGVDDALASLAGRGQIRLGAIARKIDLAEGEASRVRLGRKTWNEQ
jgi:hypothetical protein